MVDSFVQIWKIDCICMHLTSDSQRERSRVLHGALSQCIHTESSTIYESHLFHFICTSGTERDYKKTSPNRLTPPWGTRNFFQWFYSKLWTKLMGSPVIKLGRPQRQFSVALHKHWDFTMVRFMLFYSWNVSKFGGNWESPLEFVKQKRLHLVRFIELRMDTMYDSCLL